MTRKEKFKKIIASKGYKSITDLMIQIETMIEGDKEKGILKATKNKNYSNMIAGTNGKEFPPKYIKALEKVLDIPFIELIDETSNNLIPKHNNFRSIAYDNDYTKTKEFFLTNNFDKSSLLGIRDEYDKTFIDYIIVFSSINCLEFLIKEYNITHFFRKSFSPYLYNTLFNNDLVYEIAKLICKNNRVDLFSNVFNPFNSILSVYCEHFVIYEDENFAKIVLNTDKIFNNLFEIKELDIKLANRLRKIKKPLGKGKFANMLLNTMLKVAMKEPKKYETKILKILDSSCYINKEILNNLGNLKKRVFIRDNGLIIGSNKKYSELVLGQVIKYVSPILPKTSNTIKRSLSKLEESLQLY